MHIVPCQRELDNTFHLVLAGAADFIRRCEIAISDGNPKGKVSAGDIPVHADGGRLTRARGR